MHPVPALLIGLAVGLLLGPTLAGWTVRVPDKESDARTVWLAPGWWRGAGASRRRLLTVVGGSAVVLALIGAGVGMTAELPAYLWFAAAATALTVIDVEHQRLPDRITYPSYVAGLVLLGVASLVRSDGGAYVRALVIMAALLVAFFLVAFISPAALGLGDVKLAGLLGLYLGWLGAGHVLLGLFIGIAVGALWAVGLLVTRKAGLASQFAYGPALLTGALLAVAAGQPLLDVYSSAAGLS